MFLAMFNLKKKQLMSYFRKVDRAA